MAIPLFNEIEKLINEHGSAVILKERLALAADQYTALERKIIEIKERVKQSESENKILHLNLEKAEEKIRNLENERISSHGNTLEEIEVKILVYLSSVESGPVKEISNSVNCGEAKATFHLEELKTKGMVNSNRVLMLGDYWALEQPGRKYLIQNNLIK